jgi:hypothetical protein
MNKKLIAVVLIALVMIIGLVVAIKVSTKKPENNLTVNPSPVVEEGKVLDFSLTNPLVLVYPRADGNALNLEISKLNGIESVEYEMVYQTKDQQQGALGKAVLNKGDTSVKRELLFGSCSKNVCKYDQGVENGTLTIKLNKQTGISDEWRSDFNLILPSGKLFESPDKNAAITANVQTGKYIVVTKVSSLPAPVEGKSIIGVPYGFFPTNSVNQKNMKLSIKVENPDPTMKIFGWDSDNLTWIDLKGEINAAEGTIDTVVDRLTIFVVAK